MVLGQPGRADGGCFGGGGGRARGEARESGVEEMAGVGWRRLFCCGGVGVY